MYLSANVPSFFLSHITHTHTHTIHTNYGSHLFFPSLSLQRRRTAKAKPTLEKQKKKENIFDAVVRRDQDPESFRLFSFRRKFFSSFSFPFLVAAQKQKDKKIIKIIRRRDRPRKTTTATMEDNFENGKKLNLLSNGNCYTLTYILFIIYNSRTCDNNYGVKNRKKEVRYSPILSFL